MRALSEDGHTEAGGVLGLDGRRPARRGQAVRRGVEPESRTPVPEALPARKPEPPKRQEGRKACRPCISRTFGKASSRYTVPMTWRWRKVIRGGPFRWNVSRSGVGWSVGVSGFGRSPSGQVYVSIGLPGTGLYWIKYLRSRQAKRLDNRGTSESSSIPVPLEAEPVASNTTDPIVLPLAKTKNEKLLDWKYR